MVSLVKINRYKKRAAKIINKYSFDVKKLNNYTFSSKQKDVLKSQSKQIVCCGGYGSGKSLVSLKKFLSWIDEDPRDSIITSFSYNTIQKLLPTLFDDLDLDYKFSSKDSAIIYKGIKIFLYGMDNKNQAKRIRSLNLTYWYADEIILQLEDAVREVLSRLRKGVPKWIWSTNPDVPTHWVKKDWIDAQKCEYFHFTTYDNPHLSPSVDEYIESMGFNTKNSMYNRYVLGEWGSLEKNIFQNLKTATNIIETGGDAVIDPAFSGSDKTAICIGNFKKREIKLVIHQFNENVYHKIDYILSLFQLYGVKRVFIESNADQEALYKMIKNKLIGQCFVRKFRVSQQKSHRILFGINPYINFITLDKRSDNLDEILYWDESSKNDDGIDALASFCLIQDGRLEVKK